MLDAQACHLYFDSSQPIESAERVDIVVAGLECSAELRAELRGLVRVLFGDSGQLDIVDRAQVEQILTGDTLLATMPGLPRDLLDRRGKYLYFLTREVRESLAGIRIAGWDDRQRGLLDGKQIFEFADPDSLRAALQKAGESPAQHS